MTVGVGVAPDVGVTVGVFVFVGVGVGNSPWAHSSQLLNVPPVCT